MRDATVTLMWFALVSLACVGKAPGRIRGWAATPSAGRGDDLVVRPSAVERHARGMLLFGAFLVWSIYARVALALRGDHGAPPSAAFTRGDATALLVGSALYVALALLHPYFAGVVAIEW